MRYRKTVLWCLVLGISVTFAASNALAQAGERGRERGRREEAQRDRAGRFDPAQWQERRNQEMKTALGMTDEEWTAVQPLIEKVQTLNREALQMRFGFMRRRRGVREGDDAGQEFSAVSLAFAELQGAAAPDSNATDEEIRTKLKAYREARDKARQELDEAKKALREALTLRQEAALVVRGILD